MYVYMKFISFFRRKGQRLWLCSCRRKTAQYVGTRPA